MTTLLESPLGDLQASGFKTVKVHAVSHYSECIRRSGSPIEYSANIYEQLHIQLMKLAYRASNKRDAIEQIVNHNRRLENVRRIDDDLDLDREGETPASKRMRALEKVGVGFALPI